jgi:predicted dehydrogenase
LQAAGEPTVHLHLHCVVLAVHPDECAGILDGFDTGIDFGESDGGRNNGNEHGSTAVAAMMPLTVYTSARVEQPTSSRQGERRFEYTKASGETYKVLPFLDSAARNEKANRNWTQPENRSIQPFARRSALRKQNDTVISCVCGFRRSNRIDPMGYLLPKRPRPIVIIGAGGIVRDAHLPAYRIAGLPVHGICDLDQSRAQALAAQHGIAHVYRDSPEAFRNAPPDAVFDLATPPDAILPVLADAPQSAVVLIQKPMGRNLDEARVIRDLCRRKMLIAAINFQLRFAPAMMKARRLIKAGAIGQVHDMEIRVSVFMPWHMWPFLESLERMEIPLHSIHYLDLIRSFLGEPRAVWARTTRHPLVPRLASARSHIILDYGEMLRAAITTNHGHIYGLRHQEAFVKWEGTRGAIKTRLGLLMDYPKGVADEFEYCTLADGHPPEWRTVQVEGSWYPHAFIGTMASLMRYAETSDTVLPTGIEDAYHTMELVEAAYRSNDGGGTPVTHD